MKNHHWKDWISLKTLLFFFALGSFNVFLSNQSVPLWDQDEGAYAGFAYSMNATSNYWVPQFMWSEPHRKPPLHFWIMAGVQKLFGPSSFSVRFHSGVAFLLLTVLLFFFSKSLYGKSAAVLAVALLFTSFVAVLGKIAMTDGLLLLWETAAALSLIRTLRDPRFLMTCFFWFSVSMGVLTKGPPILILIIGMMTFFAFFHPQRKNLFSLHPLLGLPISLAPLAAWGYFAWQVDGGAFIRWLIDWYILKRAQGQSVFGQSGPPGYYLVSFLVFLFPWFSLLPKSLMTLIRSFREKQLYAIELTGWLIFSWLIYELIPSKLPLYAAASYPAWFLLFAINLRDHSSHLYKKTLHFGLFLHLLTSFLICGGFFWLAFQIDANEVNIPSIICSASFFTFPLVSLGFMLIKNKKAAFKINALSGVANVLLIFGLFLPTIALKISPAKAILNGLQREFSSAKKIEFGFQFNLPSLPYELLTHGYQVSDSLKTIDSKTEIESNTVLIVNDGQVKTFESFKGIKKVSIEAFVIDKGKKTRFYLISRSK